MSDLIEILKNNSYPGRAICILKCSNSNSKLFVLYWIMGRSENSRNRIFEKLYSAKSGEFVGIKIVAANPKKIEDPHLIIYNPVLIHRQTNSLIVTNGDQTNTILDELDECASVSAAFANATFSRTFEDDAPNFTPRISSLINFNSGRVAFSIIKSISPDSDEKNTNFFFYDSIQTSNGRFISTYVKDSNPLLSYIGEPIFIHHNYSNLSDLKNDAWGSLNNENKISLFACEIDLSTRQIHCEIVNKYSKA